MSARMLPPSSASSPRAARSDQPGVQGRQDGPQVPAAGLVRSRGQRGSELSPPHYRPHWSAGRAGGGNLQCRPRQPARRPRSPRPRGRAVPDPAGSDAGTVRGSLRCRGRPGARRAHHRGQRDPGPRPLVAAAEALMLSGTPLTPIGSLEDRADSRYSQPAVEVMASGGGACSSMVRAGRS